VANVEMKNAKMKFILAFFILPDDKKRPYPTTKNDLRQTQCQQWQFVPIQHFKPPVKTAAARVRRTAINVVDVSENDWTPWILAGSVGVGVIFRSSVTARP